jgi:hypothetical protein
MGLSARFGSVIRSQRWFFAGMLIGLVSPFSVIFLRRHFYVPPAAWFACFPGSLLSLSRLMHFHVVLCLVLILASNAILFGTIAAIFRGYSPLFIVTIVIVVALSLPPSLNRLNTRFPAQQAAMVKMLQLLGEDPWLADVTAGRVFLVDGRSCTPADPGFPVPSGRWRQYLSLMKQAGIEEAVWSGQGYFLITSRLDIPRRFDRRLGPHADRYATYGGVDAFATYAGYVNCPSELTQPRQVFTITNLPSGDIVCWEGKRRETSIRDDYQFRKITGDWYAFRVMTKYTSD